MKTIQLQQNTPEWHAHRSAHFNASDAPSMLGVSPYKSRDELLEEYATGVRKPVDAATQRRFDNGHRFEELARPRAEQIVGETLYPVIGTEGRLSASFDGLTAADDVVWEHKTLSASLRDIREVADLPEHYRAQMEQQLMLSGAERALFHATLWEGDSLTEEMHVWYEPDYELRNRIIQGWAQFAIDLENYKPATKKVELVGVRPDSLPALLVEVAGQLVTSSNLAEFRAGAELLIGSLKTELINDQDFLDADAAIKWLNEAEGKIDSAIENAMARTGPLEELVRTLKDVQQNLFRTTRLNLSKQVEAQKTNRRNQIVDEAKKQFAAFLAGVNAEFAKDGVSIATVNPDFYLAIKGKRSFDMMVSACNDAIAKAKIQANEIAAGYRKNLALLAEHKDHDFLFGNKQQLVEMGFDHLSLTIKSKIDDYKASTKAAEEARIRKHDATIAALQAAGDFDDDVPYEALVVTRTRLEKFESSVLQEFAMKGDQVRAASLARVNARIKVLVDEADRAEKLKAEQQRLTDAAKPVPLAPPQQAQSELVPGIDDLDAPMIHTAQPSASPTKKTLSPRPSAIEIVDVLVNHYRADRMQVIAWLEDLDTQALVDQLESAA